MSFGVDKILSYDREMESFVKDLLSKSKSVVRFSRFVRIGSCNFNDLCEPVVTSVCIGLCVYRLQVIWHAAMERTGF